MHRTRSVCGRRGILPALGAAIEPSAESREALDSRPRRIAAAHASRSSTVEAATSPRKGDLLPRHATPRRPNVTVIQAESTLPIVHRAALARSPKKYRRFSHDEPYVQSPAGRVQRAKGVGRRKLSHRARIPQRGSRCAKTASAGRRKGTCISE
jgi:hypothetical protein